MTPLFTSNRSGFALRLLALTVALVLPGIGSAQPSPLTVNSTTQRIGAVRITISPDHLNWTYTPGEIPKFTVLVMRDSEPVSGVTLKYKIGPEMLPAEEHSVVLPADGRLVLEGVTLKEPGFVRCIATVEDGGKSYRGIATAGFSPEAIAATQTDPTDFDEFWSNGRAALAKVPLDARLTLQPDACTATVNVYHVSFRTLGNNEAAPTRIYGIYCEPKAPGKYPAILRVPGAGVRPYFGAKELAEHGIITLEIGIHGIPVNLPAELYDQLRVGALDGYPTYNLENKTTYYYRRVYLGCIRANDFLVSREAYNGTDLIVMGGSQGGQLTIVTGALDSRVKAIAANYPAYSDVTGYLHGRAGGWPHMMRPDQKTGARSLHATEQKLATTQYYDTVNFARRLKIPGHYSWGYNDETCPPTSLYSVYNVITAPKKLLLLLENGHPSTPEQSEAVDQWVLNFLRLN
ncbi:MAG: acetylxylan esterase [Opitutus sp.]